MNPDAAVHQIYNKLSSSKHFKVPASEDKVRAFYTVEVVQVPTYAVKLQEWLSVEITEDEMNKFTLNIKYEQIPTNVLGLLVLSN